MFFKAAVGIAAVLVSIIAYRCPETKGASVFSTIEEAICFYKNGKFTSNKIVEDKLVKTLFFIIYDNYKLLLLVIISRKLVLFSNKSYVVETTTISSF